jgi:hypothetical protein
VRTETVRPEAAITALPFGRVGGGNGDLVPDYSLLFLFLFRAMRYNERPFLSERGKSRLVDFVTWLAVFLGGVCM